MNSRRRDLTAYALMLLIASVVLVFIFITAARTFGADWARVTSFGDFDLSGFRAHLKDSTSILFFQILAILGLSFLVARIVRRLGQPEVIGEMIAGIMLGPSLLGFLWPDAYTALFPPASLGNLASLSQLGLMIFLFLIGMEVDLSHIRNHLRAAIFISHAAIVIPFTLGVLLALYIYRQYSPAGVDFLSFGLFIGISVSITAFPVLARIVQERGLLGSPTGRMALTVAAIDDATAWCILALVVALVQAKGVASAFVTVVLALTYVLVMLFVVRPFLNRMGTVYYTREIIGRGVMASIILLILGSAVLTQLIGIHALFGAFMAGVVLPADSRFGHLVAEKLRDFASVILLPLFFALTGVRTDFVLIFKSGAWDVMGLVLLVAIGGKVGGGMLSALLVGMKPKPALELGVLINTRGLIELIILNVGYDLGILTRELFAVLVLMAFITTFMTGPILSIMHRKRSEDVPVAVKPPSARGILFSFGPVLTGISLLRIASLLRKEGERITAAHFHRSSELLGRDPVEGKIFRALHARAADSGLQLATVEGVATDISEDILSTIQKERPELLLLGGARSMFSKNRIGGKVGEVLKDASSAVGIYVEKDLPEEFRQAGILFSRRKDGFLMDYAERLRGSGVDVIILPTTEDLMEHLVAAQCPFPMRLDNDLYGEFDLLVVSVPHWLEKRYLYSDWMDDPPCSLLLIRESSEPAGE
ncbi:MAG TPA: cation:proton antiporter [Leptospiraceae bacterium]|nr:cation:proton antiporter [Leptospirales bacterium]HMX56740.1 cation:proton antiporter [Leptospiraceae bacterium]HNJ32733.1 cation:proton antiporter [Leptospiraceae bacterium]HNL00609.1 cation:proton antiporter [Leptospiraceae bacterium]HNN60440.1 cation:proton antiporter [Leptospiraceae bacterium]